MTRSSRVLDDSEDDEEDLVSWHRDIETPAHDANSNRHSTNSTEVLKAQIRNAQLEMASTAMETVATVPLSRSTLKRSRTDLLPEIPSTGYNGKLKRVRSYKDSPSLSSGLLQDSQVHIFRDHSQSRDSFFAPTGSIAEGFLAHDPYVLLGQTGDTVPDNTATQTMKQALAVKKDNARPTVVDATSEFDDRLHLRSSSVLFSGSQLFGSLERPVESVADTTIVDVDVAQVHEIVAKTGTPSQASTSSCIHVTAAKTSTSTEAATDTARAKEKVTASKEPASDKLSSSQVAFIGLPKEQYKPRPSKRRATQLPDLPPEHLNDPNKITRSKRSKTASAAAKSSKTRRGSVQDGAIDETTTQDRTDEQLASVTAEVEAGAEDNVIIEDTITVSEPVAHSTAPADDIDELAPSQPEQKDSTPPEVVFAQPAKPQRKKKATSKATKRSHTTIFEDHVDLPVKPHRPSLSQQQADRKAVLTEADKNASKGKRGKAKLIEDDGEDELASPGVPSKISTAKISKLHGEAAAPESKEQSEVAEVSAPDTDTVLPETVDMPSSPPASRPAHAITPGPTPFSIQPTTTISAPTSDPPPSSPTHSPIKASTIAHRVGLSKRHRIPSLLKIVRPMKKA